MATNIKNFPEMIKGKKWIVVLVLCGAFILALTAGFSSKIKTDNNTTIIQVNSATNPKGWDVDKGWGNDWDKDYTDTVEAEANEEITFSGVANVNVESVNKAIYFNMNKGQTFHVTYDQDSQGAFIVGVINSEGEKFLADTLLKRNGDTLSFEIPQIGKYYFYVKGLEKNSGNSYNYNFNVYFVDTPA